MAKQKQQPEPLNDTPLRLEWMEADSLTDNPANWRKHPQAQSDALRDVIAEVGWAGCLLYNERTSRLLDGHLRKKVAAGQRVPVLVGDWSEDQEKKILATLDPIAAMAEADRDQLDALLRDVQTGSAAIAGMLAELASKAGVLPEVPEPTPQKEPTLPSECYVEIYCSRDALDAFRETLDEWAERGDCTVNIS
jgi:hypothetical protein